MPARRVDFERTDVDVQCAGCHQSIPVGNRCVTILNYPEEVFLVGAKTSVTPRSVGEIGIGMTIRKLVGQAPLIEWRLKTPDLEFRTPPEVKHYHAKGCGVGEPRVRKLPGSYGARQ
jgi:hypothetical protein